MPSRIRRTMPPAPKWGVWPQDTAKIPDTFRNRVARSVYDTGGWLEEYSSVDVAERVAGMSGALFVSQMVMRQQEKVEQPQAAQREPIDFEADFLGSLQTLMQDLMPVVAPFSMGLGIAIAMRCAIPALMGSAAQYARVLGCGLIAFEKGPKISLAARKLLRAYGELPQAPATPSQPIKRVPMPTSPATATRPPAKKKTRQRTEGAQLARGKHALVAWPSPRAEKRLSGASPAVTPISCVAKRPTEPSLIEPSPPVAQATPTVVAAPPPSLAVRCSKKVDRAAAPCKPRGPHITGLSYNNHVVVERGHELHWDVRENYAEARLRSIRPAPHKTVAPAHRHTPSVALQQAFNRALCLRRAHGLRGQDVVDVLRRYGYHTYLVGGLVRDILHSPGLDMSRADLDLATDAPTSEVQRLVTLALETELPNLKVTSSHVAHYQGVTSYQNIDIASIRVRGMFEPKRFNHSTYVPVYPLSFGTHLPSDAGNRDFTCNAVYYDPVHNLLLDPTAYGVADAKARVLRAPKPQLSMMNTTWALRYLKFILRGYAPANAAVSSLMYDNARKFFKEPRFARALERIHEGEFDVWCGSVAEILLQMGHHDLAERVCVASCE